MQGVEAGVPTEEQRGAHLPAARRSHGGRTAVPRRSWRGRTATKRSGRRRVGGGGGHAARAGCHAARRAGRGARAPPRLRRGESRASPTRCTPPRPVARTRRRIAAARRASHLRTRWSALTRDYAPPSHVQTRCVGVGSGQAGGRAGGIGMVVVVGWWWWEGKGGGLVSRGHAWVRACTTSTPPTHPQRGAQASRRGA